MGEEVNGLTYVKDDGLATIRWCGYDGITHSLWMTEDLGHTYDFGMWGIQVCDGYLVQLVSRSARELSVNGKNLTPTTEDIFWSACPECLLKTNGSGWVY